MVRPYDRNLKGASRKLRKTMTKAERLLWSRLRRKQILQIQFHSQEELGPYIVDFYAPAVNLVVEVDGSQHLDDEHVVVDTERDDFLKRQGLLVVRYDNRQVLVETDAVVEEIFRVCGERLNPPCPPFAKEGT
jgi:very-short-patch-repair endonuclease